MMDATTTRDLATRGRLGAGGRLQLDALAQYGGRGRLDPRPLDRFTLSVLRSPHNPDRWTELHTVTGTTLRNLARLGMVELDDLARPATVELTDAGRRVAELAG